MDKTKSMFSLLAAFLFVITFTTVGQAQSQRTFVAGPGIGTDANLAAGCTFAQPCRFFQTAFGVTNAGGEIIALSPGAGYGGLTINKAITVTGLPGNVAFVAINAGGTGFSVVAGANDLVVLRNISFNGQNAGANTGLLHSSGKLIIDNCNFSELATGLRVTGATVVASKSSFTSNSSRGVHVSGTGKVDLQDCNISYNAVGVTVDGPGGCLQPSTTNPALAPTTFARLDKGIVSNNTTFAFEMLNPGVSPCGILHGQNIFLRGTSSATIFSTTVPGYVNQSTNFLFVTGVASGSQVIIGSFNSNNQGLQP